MHSQEDLVSLPSSFAELHFMVRGEKLRRPWILEHFTGRLWYENPREGERGTWHLSGCIDMLIFLYVCFTLERLQAAEGSILRTSRSLFAVSTRWISSALAAGIFPPCCAMAWLVFANTCNRITAWSSLPQKWCDNLSVWTSSLAPHYGPDFKWKIMIFAPTLLL